MKKNDFDIASYRGMTFLGWLQIVFITLKLANEVNWSWWIVLLPLIISSILGLIAIFVSIIMFTRDTISKELEDEYYCDADEHNIDD